VAISGGYDFLSVVGKRYMLIILAIINRYLAIRDYLLRLVIAEARWYSIVGIIWYIIEYNIYCIVIKVSLL